MNEKEQLIRRLEGRWIKTASGNYYQIKNGRFTTADGEKCHLVDYTKYHLKAFLFGSCDKLPHDAHIMVDG